MRKLTAALACTAALLFSVPAHADKLIQIIFDNSGALQNADQGILFGATFLNDLATKLQGSAGRNSVVHVVVTNNPRTIFEGSGRDLKTALDTYGAQEIAHVPDGCNQLAEAIDRASLFASQQVVDEIETYVFSSLIPTGAPCNTRIRLPQPVPANINLRDLVRPETTVLKFLWADRQQERVWADYIRKSDLLQRIRDQEVDFTISGERTTQNFVIRREILR